MNTRISVRKLGVVGLALSGLTAFASFVPEGLDDSVIAFYPLTGYENGTRWTTPSGKELDYTNSTYGASAPLLTNMVDGSYVIVPRIAQYGYVAVTNETPARYLFANRQSKVPMLTDYMSLQPVTIAQKTGKYGTWFAIEDFGKMMAAEAEKTKAFTLELFVKPNSTKCYGNCFWFDIGTGDNQHRVQVQVPYTGSNVKVIRASTYDTFASTVTLSSDARDSKWHHIAIVYEQPDPNVDGTVCLYYDYQKAASVASVKRDTTQGGIRFGDHGSTDGWPGLYSAIRVSNKALTADEMLRASDDADGYRETIGFYPFDEQPAGTVFDAGKRTDQWPSGRTFWTGFYGNRATTAGYASSGKPVELGVKHTAGVDPNVDFYATNDVPGRYVYSGLSALSPLRELQSSLCELGSKKAGGPNGGGRISMAGIGEDLYHAGKYTVEFFVKFLTEPGLFGFFDLGPAEENRFVLKRQTVGELRAEFTLKKGETSSIERTCAAYPDLTSFVDGKWHHYALVSDGGSARVYCDYTLVGNSISVEKGATIPVGAAIRLGEGNQWAHYSCLRVTAAALTPQEFLYASDRADGVLANANWNWRLEGAAGAVVDSATTVGTVLDADQYLFKDMHGFVGTAASGGSLLYELPFMRGKRLIGGVADGRNLTAAATAGSYLVSGLTGPLCAPGLVFTAEALAKGTAPASGAATVFGAESPVGTSVWNLALDASGALQLNYTLQDGTVASAKVMDGFAGDAHHVALAADILNRQFKVYVDFVEKLSVTAAKPLATDGLQFVAAGGCGQSVLTGSIDEIRLTHALLEPSAFEKVERQGLLLVVE